MAKRKIKLILDTNLWISFLISNNYTQLENILFIKKAKLIFSQELLEEFLNVVKRPKFRRFFSFANTKELLETIQDYSEFINVKSDVKICRDEKDNFLFIFSKRFESRLLNNRRQRPTYSKNDRKNENTNYHRFL